MLAGAGLQRDLGVERGLSAADVIHLDARGVLVKLPEGQALLLIGGGIDGQLPLRFRARHEFGHDPGGLRALRAGGRTGQRRDGADDQMFHGPLPDGSGLGRIFVTPFSQGLYGCQTQGPSLLRRSFHC